jgi:hypothetical protein
MAAYAERFETARAVRCQASRLPLPATFFSVRALPSPDSAGNYRLINLPPGTFTVSAQLAGFSTARREGVLLRAGSNFQVDMTMELGALEESITVSGDAPMLEVTKPSNVLTIDAEFQKEAPVVEGKVLERLPDADTRRHLASAQ